MILALLLLLFQANPSSCTDVRDCRQQALAAAAERDYARFHDLAWRAVQKGRPNDPDLMYLLARAQALSGHLDDAAVMLGRIADLGVKTDAATNEDFALVRLLKDWPALAARLAAVPPSAPGASASPPAPAPAPVSTSAAPAATAPSSPSAPVSSAPADALSFAPAVSDPIGLAHDAVSRRFVVGDRQAARLLIVDEVSHHVVTYVSAASAGFYDDLTAFTIDARRGDLWVASAKGTADDSTAVLHKLQLVSGRTLLEVRLPESMKPARFVAATVTDDGTVYLLDSLGSRLFRLRPSARALESVMRLAMHAPTAMTRADERTLYVANDHGVTRLDVETHAAKPVKSVDDLSGFASLEWSRGALIGIESFEDEAAIVRVKLDDSGTRALGRQVLVSPLHRTAGVLAGDSYYYLAGGGAIRRLSVR